MKRATSKVTALFRDLLSVLGIRTQFKKERENPAYHYIIISFYSV